jgi:hypothetical protein
MNDTCKVCKFYKTNPSFPDGGWCRRFPPQFFVHGSDGDIDSDGSFPYLKHTEWCGEFKTTALAKEPHYE